MVFSTNCMQSGQIQTPAESRGTVLVVDDEPGVLRVVTRMLERLGYNVLTAEDGVDGLSVYSRFQACIDIVLLDLVMPNMNGTVCLRELQRINPHVRVILSTGFQHDALAVSTEGLAQLRRLQKPFRLAALQEALSACLSGDSHYSASLAEA